MKLWGVWSFHVAARNPGVQRAQAVLELCTTLAQRCGRTGYLDVLFDVKNDVLESVSRISNADHE
jgi:hypothetical protein